METILTVSNLTKKFGYLTAVQDLSFSIEKGNVYGILGPNGSGKSTTLGIVLNVVNSTNGSFSWFDGNISTHEALKKVGANAYTVMFNNGGNLLQVDVRIVPAVPVPAAVWLFGSGLVGLIAVARRKALV